VAKRFFDLDGLLKSWVRRPPRPARVCKEPKQPKQPYHAVTLRAPKGACAAAKALAERRFLAAEAPRLPLADCTSGRCLCTFAHHDDRRHQARRDGESHPEERPADASYIRKGKGRRKEDQGYFESDEYFDHVSTATLRQLTLPADAEVDGDSEAANGD